MQQIILDKPRNLRFNVNSLAWLEAELCELMGKASGDFIARFLDTLKEAQFPGFRIMRALLWSCLRHEDKSLTIDQVGDMLTSDRIGEAFEKCLAAMNEFFAEGNQSPLSGDSVKANGGVSAGTTLN